jgi:hypothetical protein
MPVFTPGSSLPQQVPALMKLDLDLRQPFLVLGVGTVLQPQPETLVGEPPDVTEDRCVLHAFRS